MELTRRCGIAHPALKNKLEINPIAGSIPFDRIFIVTSLSF